MLNLMLTGTTTLDQLWFLLNHACWCSLTFSSYLKQQVLGVSDAGTEKVHSILKRQERSFKMTMSISTQDLSLFLKSDMLRSCSPFSSPLLMVPVCLPSTFSTFSLFSSNTGLTSSWFSTTTEKQLDIPARSQLLLRIFCQSCSSCILGSDSWFMGTPTSTDLKQLNL